MSAPPLPAPLCAWAAAYASAPLYLSLLPAALLAEVDRLIAINTWRAGGVALMKLPLPARSHALAPEYRRYMLATGEELLVSSHMRSEKTTLILEPGTQAMRKAAIAGRFKAFLPAERDGREDLFLAADVGNAEQCNWSLYTIAAALSGGAPLLQRPLRPRPLGARDISYLTWPSSMCGEWFQAGPDFYRMPLMQHCVHEPAALSFVPYDVCAVLGAPEQERFWLVTDFSSSVAWHTLAAYDFRTGAKLYSIDTDTEGAEHWWFLWPDQLMGAARNMSDQSVTMHSLIDGSPIAHTDAASAAAILPAPTPHSWKRARRRANAMLLSTDTTPPVVWDFGTSLYTTTDNRFMTVSVGDWQHPAKQRLQHLSVPSDASMHNMHSDAVFFLQAPATPAPTKPKTEKKEKRNRGGTTAASTPAPPPVNDSSSLIEEFDLFGEGASDEANQEALAKFRKTHDERKRSEDSVALEIKPRHACSLEDLEAAVRGIATEGLVWGAAEPVPVGSGARFNLRIVATIIDGLVSIEAVQDCIQSSLPELVKSVSIAPPDPYVCVICLSDPDRVHRMCTLPAGSQEPRFMSAEGAFLHGPIVQARDTVYCVCRPPVPASLSVLRGTGSSPVSA